MKIFNGINTTNFSEISHGHTNVLIVDTEIIKIKASNHKYTVKDIQLIIKSIGFFTISDTASSVNRNKALASIINISSIN